MDRNTVKRVLAMRKTGWSVDEIAAFFNERVSAVRSAIANAPVEKCRLCGEPAEVRDLCRRCYNREYRRTRMSSAKMRGEESQVSSAGSLIARIRRLRVERMNCYGNLKLAVAIMREIEELESLVDEQE